MHKSVGFYEILIGFIGSCREFNIMKTVCFGFVNKNGTACVKTYKRCKLFVSAAKILFQYVQGISRRTSIRMANSDNFFNAVVI